MNNGEKITIVTIVARLAFATCLAGVVYMLFTEASNAVSSVVNAAIQTDRGNK